MFLNQRVLSVTDGNIFFKQFYFIDARKRLDARKRFSRNEVLYVHTYAHGGEVHPWGPGVKLRMALCGQGKAFF
jgi:hypothetical protein